MKIDRLKVHHHGDGGAAIQTAAMSAVALLFEVRFRNMANLQHQPGLLAHGW